MEVGPRERGPEVGNSRALARTVGDSRLDPTYNLGSAYVLVHGGVLTDAESVTGVHVKVEGEFFR